MLEEKHPESSSSDSDSDEETSSSEESDSEGDDAPEEEEAAQQGEDNAFKGAPHADPANAEGTANNAEDASPGKMKARKLIQELD